MIRKAELKDLDAINNLLYQVHKVHSDGRPDYFIAGQKKYTDAELEKLIKEGIAGSDERKAAGFPETAEAPIYVYENEDGVVVGHAFLKFENIGGDHSVYARKNLYIDDMCVDSKMRKQGVSTALFSHIREVAKANKCDSITFNVWALNPEAKKHFEKMGFKTLKTTMEQEIK